MSANVATIPQRTLLLASMAQRYGMEPGPFERTIRATVMPAGHTTEEFAACLLVAHEHKLNPITREIFFMKTRGGGIQPIVSVDGWVTLANSHPQFDGMEFADNVGSDGALVSITCRMFRKDRARPVEVTEYMAECKGESPAWKKTPSRMLRHRAMIQCARYAFGFAGIMEPDEFEQWQSNARTAPTIVARDAVLDLPDVDTMPVAPQIAVAADDETSQAREAIGSAISVDMLQHIRTVYPDADWEVLAADYDAKLDELQARAA